MLNHFADLLAKFFLNFGHYEVIGPLAAWGYLCHDRVKWGRVIYITLFSMIVATYLKGIWQIPLSPHLKSNGWAFPSGHMMGATVFYISIAREMQKRWVTNLVILILSGEAFGLVQQRYHNIYDVAAAVASSLILLFFWQKLTRLRVFRERADLLLLPLMPLAIAMLAFMPIMHPHMPATLLAMVFFGFGWSITYKGAVHRKIYARGVSLVKFIIVSFVFYQGISYFNPLPLYLLITTVSGIMILLNMVLVCGGAMEEGDNIRVSLK